MAHWVQVVAAPRHQAARRRRPSELSAVPWRRDPSGPRARRVWGRGQGGYGAGPTVSHLLKKGARGVGVEKEKEIKRVIPHISNRRPRPRRGAQTDTRLGWHKAVGSPQRPAWTRGLPPALGIGSQGARANAGRGAAQSETATIRVRQHSFESFFPGVWSQPRGTGPGREPKRGRGGKGRRTAYSEETSQVSRL